MESWNRPKRSPSSSEHDTFGIPVAELLGYHLMRAAPMVTEVGMCGWGSEVLLGLMVVAGLVWLAFLQGEQAWDCCD